MFSDAYHKKSYWIKVIISMLSGAFAVFAIVLCTFYQFSFAFLMIMLGINYISAEAWGAPTITMLQDVTPNETIGFLISVYLFLIIISGMIGIVILGSVQNWVNA